MVGKLSIWSIWLMFLFKPSFIHFFFCVWGLSNYFLVNSIWSFLPLQWLVNSASKNVCVRVADSCWGLEQAWSVRLLLQSASGVLQIRATHRRWERCSKFLETVQWGFCFSDSFWNKSQRWQWRAAKPPSSLYETERFMSLKTKVLKCCQLMTNLSSLRRTRCGQLVPLDCYLHSRMLCCCCGWVPCTESRSQLLINKLPPLLLRVGWRLWRMAVFWPCNVLHFHVGAVQSTSS